jgi:hypothetical protein
MKSIVLQRGFREARDTRMQTCASGVEVVESRLQPSTSYILPGGGRGGSEGGVMDKIIATIPRGDIPKLINFLKSCLTA